jgi:hypothetical protein
MALVAVPIAVSRALLSGAEVVVAALKVAIAVVRVEAALSTAS